MADTPTTSPETRSDAEWRSALTPEQYRVLREHGTERAGTSCLLAEKRAGTFTCAGCGQPLFEQGTKFEVRAQVRQRELTECAERTRSVHLRRLEYLG